MSESSLINAYLNKPLVNTQVINKNDENIHINIKKDKTKQIQQRLNNINSGFKVFELITKKDFNILNIKDFIIFIQWKHPEYTHTEISNYFPLDEQQKNTKEIKDSEQKSTVDYITVKAFRDVSVFTGCDNKNYKINEGDVVSIPKINAAPLIRGKVVVEVLDLPEKGVGNTRLLHVREVEKYFTEIWERNHGPVNSINLVKFCMDCAPHLKLTTEEIKPIAVKLFAIIPKQPPEQTPEQPPEPPQPPGTTPECALIKTTEDVDQVVKDLKEGGF